MITGKMFLIVMLAVLLLVAGFVGTVRTGNLVEVPVALSFSDCEKRGYQVIEAPLRRCSTPEGISFIEVKEMTDTSFVLEKEPVAPTLESEVPRACMVRGCSSQFCVEESDPGFSTCEYKAEYACYKSAVCTRQANGICGWTQALELTTCLRSPPAP